MNCKVKLHEFLAIILFFECTNHVYAFRVFDYNGVETILALENELIAIQCKTDSPISYCGFLHPSGMRYSFTELAMNNGKCVVKINATRADVGEWKCHIGMKSKRVEMMKRIDLRVVGHIAAVKANETVVHGKTVTLDCTTTKGLVPISYCRFEPPNGSPFSIDSTVNASHPILNKYYFPPNRSLDRGDCAVTIKKVKYEDVGVWTCGAALDDGQEYIDLITVEVEEYFWDGTNALLVILPPSSHMYALLYSGSACQYTVDDSRDPGPYTGPRMSVADNPPRLYAMSTASVTGVTLGGIFIVAVLGALGYVAWKRSWFLGSRQHEGDVMEIQELGQQRIPQSTPQGSPQVRRLVPSVVVQSPSEPSESVSST